MSDETVDPQLVDVVVLVVCGVSVAAVAAVVCMALWAYGRRP